MLIVGFLKALVEGTFRTGPCSPYMSQPINSVRVMLRIDGLVLLIINPIHNGRGGCESVNSKQIDGKLIYIALNYFNNHYDALQMIIDSGMIDIYWQICL